MLRICLLLSLATVALCGVYDGFQVWRLGPIWNRHRTLSKLIAAKRGVDVWRSTHFEGGEITIMIPPRLQTWVRRQARRHKVKIHVQESNVQRKVDLEKERLAKRMSESPDGFNLDDFNDYNQINQKLTEFQQACGSKGLTCSLSTLGSSHEGRAIRMLQISSGPGRKRHYINSLIHAREWLSGATNLKIMNHLIQNYNSDATVTRLVNAYDWCFIPILNPDGYVYSWTNERYWRKNRRSFGECYGADLNRNFDARWDTTPSGSSPDPCDDTHRGPSANSEPETQVLVSHMDAVRASTTSWSSMHAYAHIWLFSYGGVERGTDENDRRCLTADYDNQLRVGEAVIREVERVGNGATWTTGPICRAIYPAAGGSIDYMYNTNNCKYTFGPELRGTDFIIDASEIEPSFQEIWAGFVVQVDTIASL